MARKDALLRLHAGWSPAAMRSVRPCNGDLDGFREFPHSTWSATMSMPRWTRRTTRSAPAGRDREPRTRPDRACLAPDRAGRLRPLRVLRAEDLRGSAQRLALHEYAASTASARTSVTGRHSAPRTRTSDGRRSTTSRTMTPTASPNQPQRFRDGPERIGAINLHLRCRGRASRPPGKARRPLLHCPPLLGSVGHPVGTSFTSRPRSPHPCPTPRIPASVAASPPAQDRGRPPTPPRRRPGTPLS